MVDFEPYLTPEALGAPPSGIVEVFNYGRNRPGLIPLWVGEGDLPTPDFIRAAAAASLEAGETFYTYQRGLPELRAAIAAYLGKLYERPVSAERIFVTGSGMHALQIAIRLVAGAGDEVVVPTPAWPNFAGAIGVGGARPVCVPMDFSENGWSLDLEKIERAMTPRTKAIAVNSPSNPTGWVATTDELRAILDLARARGLWIIADEIYGRFVYDGAERAPSFRDVMEPHDRVLFVQTFSKNWAMTGWRVGWLEAPESLGDLVENLVQYSNSGVAVFMQRGAVCALEKGDAFTRMQIERARIGGGLVRAALLETGRVRVAPLQGAFYHFFAIDGETDTRRRALDLVDRAGVGLAPGTAFGPGGENYLRLCFARNATDLALAAERLATAIRGEPRRLRA